MGKSKSVADEDPKLEGHREGDPTRRLWGYTDVENRMERCCKISQGSRAADVGHTEGLSALIHRLSPMIAGSAMRRTW